MRTIGQFAGGRSFEGVQSVERIRGLDFRSFAIFRLLRRKSGGASNDTRHGRRGLFPVRNDCAKLAFAGTRWANMLVIAGHPLLANESGRRD
jgi:hypothetical protein